jgi:hypothetical protein
LKRGIRSITEIVVFEEEEITDEILHRVRASFFAISGDPHGVAPSKPK